MSTEQQKSAATEPQGEDTAAPDPETAPSAEEEGEFETDRSSEEVEADATPSAEEQVAELNDRLLRALAETENLRRRAQRDREDASKYAISGFARDLLTSLDNLRRALDSLPQGPGDVDNELKSFVEGVELTEKDLLSTFERHGICRIEPLDEKFNAEFHEAMFEVPTNDKPQGTVVQVVEVGYTLNDRLLRPARVGVAKAVAEPEEQSKIDTTV